MRSRAARSFSEIRSAPSWSGPTLHFGLDDHAPSPALDRRARVGRRLCVAGASIGALGLVASLLGAGELTRIAGGEPPVTPNAALALLLAGGAAALRARPHVGPVRG